jgi:flagellar assembly protein FliH
MGDAHLREAIDAERRKAFETGRQEGARTARSEADATMSAAIAQERARVTSSLSEFRDARERYFTAVEPEVVKLSLAIAARVLHREVLMDPLLLESAVRVALEKLDDRSNITLRVPADQVNGWQALLQPMEAANRTTIAGDSSLRPGQCHLETHMGSVDLGIAAQLEEIERGFFDLLNHRPVS